MAVRKSVCLSLSLLAIASCAPSPMLKYTIKMPERQAKLPNGMRVFLLPDQTSELVELDVRVEVGSKEDPPGRAGLAHLVEHLMFLQRPDGADRPTLGAVLRQASVYHNAFTNWDSTHYQTLARPEELDKLVRLEATRLQTGCETITEEAFAREREVVRNEIRQRMGTPDDQVYVRLLEDVYPEGHPYRRMVGGDDAQLASITLADACAFMRDYYVPERTTVIVAGRVDEAAAAAATDQWLLPLPARTGAALVDVPAVGKAQKPVVHEMDVDEDSLIVAWPVPPLFAEDAEAFRFIAGAVFGMTAFSGSMYEFASDVEPILLGGARAPVFAVRVGLRGRKDAGEARAAVFRAAEGAGRGMHAGEQWDAVRARILGFTTMSLEPLTTRARLYGDYAQFDAENKNFGGELERIQKLDPDRLKKVIERTLDPSRATVITIHARKGSGGGYARAAGAGITGAGPPTQDELPVERGEAAQAIALPEHSTSLSRARRLTLGNGMKVVFLQTDSTLPVLTAKLIFSVGEAHDPSSQLGLAATAAGELFGPMASKGEAGWIYHYDGFGLFGIDWDTAIDPDNTVFTTRGLSIHQDVVVKGLERMIKDNLYSQRSIEERQRLFELSLRRRSVQSERTVERALAEAVYGAGHPYATTAVAPAAMRKKVGLDEVHAFSRKHYSAANATLILAGSFDEARAEAEIRDTFGDWGKGHADLPVAAPAGRKPGAIAVGVVGPPSPQVRLHLAFPAPRGMDVSFAAREVMVEVLNRRVAAIRERLGASYGIYARYRPRRGPGMIEIGGAVDAERAGEALVALEAAIDDLRHGQSFLEDFVRARQKVLERALVNGNDSTSLAERLAEIAEFDLPPSFFDEHLATIAALNPQHVLGLAQRELDPALQVLVVEGERTPIERALAAARIENARIVDAEK